MIFWEAIRWCAHFGALSKGDEVRSRDGTIITWYLFVYANIFFLEPENAHDTKICLKIVISIPFARSLRFSCWPQLCWRGAYTVSLHTPHTQTWPSELGLPSGLLLANAKNSDERRHRLSYFYTILTRPSFFALVMEREKPEPFFMLLTIPSPAYVRTESGTSSTE